MAAPTLTQTPARSTRRSTRKHALEQANESDSEVMTAIQEEKIESIDSVGSKFHQSGIIEEMLAEAAQGVIMDPTRDIQVEVETSVQDNEVSESIHKVYDSDMIQAQEIVIQTEDDKSSSFPFGNVQLSENSDGKVEENVTNISECVDSSLLASLVGDNANSLPSAESEESQSKENLEPTENESRTPPIVPVPQPPPANDDSQSQPAMAEDLQNDELPTVSKPKVTDAEEVSDDELPAPKRAELPADTEVVSEDEFPSASKKESSAV